MNRFRSRFRAAVVLALIVAAGCAGAASITVTTTTDDVVNDDLCSIREAVTASDLASQLSRRTSAKGQVTGSQAALELALDGIEQDPNNNSYPRGEMLAIVQGLIDETADYNSAVYDATLAADLTAYQGVIEALPNNVDDVALVQNALDLQERVIVAEGKEIVRLDGIIAVDGCDNGTSFDTVQLKSDTTYYLKTQLNLPQRIKIRGDENTIIAACDTSAHCSGSAPVAHRLIVVEQGAVVEFSRLTLQGGDAGVNGGGALEVSAAITIDQVKFVGNRARYGGAIHATATGALDMANVEFTGNSASEDGGAISFAGTNLVIDDATIGRDLPGEGNAADTNTTDAIDGRGGALFLIPSSGIGSFTLTRVSIMGNSAAIGSAVFVTGPYASLVLINATVARNDASIEAAIEFDSGVSSDLRLNNVTLVENNYPPVLAAVGTAGLHVTQSISLLIANTVIAGNNGAAPLPADGDCDFGVLAVLDVSFRRNYYANGSVCPGAAWPTNQPELDNFELGALQPLIGYLLNPVDVDAGFYVPVYPDDASDSAENRLVNRGAGVQDLIRCESEDQRTETRASSFDTDCDIGAIEYQVGHRGDDTIEALVDERICIDVISNDIGDANYVDGSLRIVPGGIERPGAVAVVVSRSSIDPALDLDLVCPNQADIPFNDAILFVPAPGFHGETNVAYGLQWQSGAALTAVSGDVTAIAHIETDSRGGITSSSIGAGGFWFLAALLLLGMRSFAGSRVLLSACLAFVAVSVSATDNIIYVNSDLDEPEVTTPGDRRCTLREAVTTARNDQANLTGGDCLDGNEGPDIIEFAAGTTQVMLEDSVLAFGGIKIRCPEPAAGDPPVLCRIFRNPLAAQPFRLFDSRGSIAFERMQLEGGVTEAVGTKTSGGALFSTGAVSVLDSVFKNNTAVNGGAIFLGGTRSSLSISGSTFDGNVGLGTGTSGGGAIATSQSDDHNIQIQSSTFVRNTSVGGAAALDLNTSGSAKIANSTFSGNESAEGPGAIDVSGVRGSAVLRNLTVVDNFSGLDPTLEVWENPLLVTPPVQRAAIEVGPVAVILTSSIVGANFKYDSLLPAPHRDYLVNANCGPGPIDSFYNLFGDAGSVAPRVCVPDVNSMVLAPAAVFDYSAPASSLLDVLQDVGAGTDMHPVNTLVEAGQIVDAGYQVAGDAANDQVSPFELTGKCANIDQRDVSRVSGGACDRGAYETLEITAVDDRGSNSGRNDRLIVVDIISNDLFDNLDLDTDNDIKQDCTVLDTSVVGVFSWKDVFGDTCVDVMLGTETGTVSFLRSPADQTAIGFETSSGYVMRYDNGGAIAIENIGGEIDVTYRVYTVAQVASNIGHVVMTVDNIRPTAVSDTVHVPVGGTAILNVLANDSDQDLVVPATLTIANINGAGCDSVVDPNTLAIDYWQCQFGKVYVDMTSGVITFTPDNGYNPFRQTFTYEISDNDPMNPKQSSAQVDIVVDHEDDNGGAILGNDDLSDMLGINFLGAPGNLFFVSLLLSLLRRRKHAQSRVLH